MFGRWLFRRDARPAPPATPARDSQGQFVSPHRAAVILKALELRRQLGLPRHPYFDQFRED